MFPRRFYAARHFAPHFFPEVGADVLGIYWGPRYYAGYFYAQRYFPGRSVPVTLPGEGFYWAPRFYAFNFYAPRYFPGVETAVVAPTPAVEDTEGGFARAVAMSARFRRRQLQRERWRELQTVRSSGTRIVLRLHARGGGIAVEPDDEEDVMFLLGIPQ